MRMMICIALCAVLGAAGCAVGDDVIESSDDTAARMASVDDEIMEAQADLTSVLPADVVGELTAIGCPINCVGVCACAFRWCVRYGNDPIECGNEQDLCIEACYE